MARIDRRVSPNQLSLWTVCELVHTQAVQFVPLWRSLYQRFRCWSEQVGRLLVAAAVGAAMDLAALGKNRNRWLVLR